MAPQSKGKIDWDSIPDSQVVTQNGKINWATVPPDPKSPLVDPSNPNSPRMIPDGKGGWLPPSTRSGFPQGQVSANPEGHTVANWFNDLENDVKHGGGRTLPGRILSKAGVQPVESGAGGGEGGVGDIMGGALLGPTEVGHGVASIPNIHTGHQAINAANDIIRGAGHTLGPVGALTAPEAVVPSMIYAPAAIGAGRAVTALGGTPDEAELAGNLTGMAQPLIHTGLPAAGTFVQDHAPAIGKAAGYGGAIGELIHSKNPMSLLLGTPTATKAATAAASAVGKGMEAVGTSIPKPQDFIGGPGAPTPPENLSTPLALPRGAIQLPASEPNVEPMIQPAASQIIRGNKGRMQKQFLTSTDQGNGPQYGSVPPLIGGLGESQTPPPVDPGSSVTDTSQLKGNGINPPTLNQPLIKVPDASSQSLTNENESPNINTGDNPLPDENSLINSPNMSRRNFLGLGAKAAASAVVPKGGIVGDLINSNFSTPESTQNFIPQAAGAASEGSYLPTMTGHFSNYLNSRSEGENNFTPESFTDDPENDLYGSSTIKSVTPHGQDNIVHALADDGDGGGASHIIARIGPAGNVKNMIHGFDGDFNVAMNENGITPTDYEPTPQEKAWTDKLHNSEFNDEDLDTIPPEETTTQQPEETHPPVETSNSSEDNNDLIDTRGLQQDFRDRMDRDQESSDELGNKLIYYGNKPDVGKVTGEQYRPNLPGQGDNTDLLPWAQTPWGSNKGATGYLQPKSEAITSTEDLPDLPKTVPSYEHRDTASEYRTVTNSIKDQLKSTDRGRNLLQAANRYTSNGTSAIKAAAQSGDFSTPDGKNAQVLLNEIEKSPQVPGIKWGAVDLGSLGGKVPSEGDDVTLPKLTSMSYSQGTADNFLWLGKKSGPGNRVLVKIDGPVKGLNLSSMAQRGKSGESEFLTNGDFTVDKVEKYRARNSASDHSDFDMITLKPKSK